MRILVDDTAAAVGAAAARLVAAELAELGAATLALAGGSTPRAAHEALRRTHVDWGRVTMWLADERWVPADDPESNERMARETLVDAVGGTLLAPTYGDDPNVAAARYEALLDSAWVERDGRRRPDIVMLGIGDDGHTASLFPGSDALDRPSAGYVANWVAAKDSWRLTATVPLLCSARHIVFLVTGAGKSDVVRRILGDREPFPAQRVAAEAEGEVTWLLDEAAASRLDLAR